MFKMSGETSHELGLDMLGAFERLSILSRIAPKIPDCPVEVMGIKYPNPVGLAAGLDKNGDYIDAFACLGFGSIEIGTITPRPQPGNPKPRLFRLADKQAIINRMGFNNKGVDHLVEQVKKAKFKGVLGINIGKNFDTPVANAIDDYLICLNKVYQYATYITVNISSPNTPGLRDLQFGDTLDELLAPIKARQLELAEEFGVHNFVFSSSCTVYGEPEGLKVVTEESPTQEANSPYGATKQMCERIISDLQQSGSKIRALNLRYFNPVGAHPSAHIGELPIGKPNNLLPYVTQTAAGILEQLTVFGKDYNTADGTCIRDYIHVVDLAKAHTKGYEWLSKQEAGTLETVNVGTGNGVSVLEIIHTFEKVSGTSLNWKFGERRAGDVEQIFADASKAQQLLGWRAERTIEDAVTDAWNWQKKLGNE
jgi:UDP-glucose-4-epimerase GalE